MKFTSCRAMSPGSVARWPSSCSDGVIGRPGSGAKARRHLVLQPGDTHLEELVQPAREDGEELHPLEERELVVFGEVEQAIGEVEPRELPVDEAVRNVGNRSADQRAPLW